MKNWFVFLLNPPGINFSEYFKTPQTFLLAQEQYE